MKTGLHRRFLLGATMTLVFAVILLRAIPSLADSVKRLFYSVRVETGTVAEAEIYYAVTDAPATLDEWMAKYNFPRRLSGENLDAYRQRVGIAVYYNRDELGLGRELGCAPFQDVGPSGEAKTGLACFVRNYGERFVDSDQALAEAVAGEHVMETFTLVYAPSSTPPASGLGAGVVPRASYAVSFECYGGGTGDRQNVSFFDTAGFRPVPMICTNCHGGTYDAIDHLVIGGKLQPINPSILAFSSAPGYTLADQEARIAALNALMATIPNCATSGNLGKLARLSAPHAGVAPACE